MFSQHLKPKHRDSLANWPLDIQIDFSLELGNFPTSRPYALHLRLHANIGIIHRRFFLVEIVVWRHVGWHMGCFVHVVVIL